MWGINIRTKTIHLQSHIDKRSEAHQGRVLVSLVRRVELQNWEVLRGRPKRSHALAAVHVERPNRFPIDAGNSRKKVREGWTGVVVFEDEPLHGVEEPITIGDGRGFVGNGGSGGGGGVRVD